jgi:acetamidase/formamidase
MLHTLVVEPPMLHGRFSQSRTPVLRVEPGDLVELKGIPDVSWGLEPPTSLTAPRRKVEPRVPGLCMVGPIFVNGATPGDALEITFEEITPGPWGWTYAGKGMANPAHNASLGIGDAPLTLLMWSLDARTGTATDQLGTRVAMRPFLGTIGLAPAEDDACAWTPRTCGGNMDCRELVQGTSLLLPVQCDGALLSMGDGHAAQGDGELGGTAIECLMDCVRLRLTLHHGLHLPGPLARTPSGTVTLGFAETLDAAAAIAAGDMLTHVAREKGIDRAHAAALAGVCMSLHVTQMVNPLRGMHAIWHG